MAEPVTSFTWGPSTPFKEALKVVLELSHVSILEL